MFTLLKFILVLLIIFTEITRAILLLGEKIKKLQDTQVTRNIFIRLYWLTVIGLALIISTGLAVWYTSV